MSVVASAVQRLPALEHLRGMAPDYATLRAAEELVWRGAWGQCGWSQRHALENRLLWAEFPNGRRPATQTAVLLPELIAVCSCVAARFPCRHILALTLRDHYQALDLDEPPEWASSRIEEARSHRLADALPDDSVTDLQRIALLRGGMTDLGLWLADLTRQGLASLPKRDRRLWLDAANRLVDAYAFEAARELRALSLLPGAAPDWPERLLPRLGRLALLSESFRRFDELSLGEQGDMLMAAGDLFLPVGDRTADAWLVCGRGQAVEGKQQRARTWLWGRSSGRWALLSDTHPSGLQEGTCYPVGATLGGELTYSPSAWPLSAHPVNGLRHIPVDPAAAGMAVDIEEAVAGYAGALAVNPWLRCYPVALREVYIEPVLQPPRAIRWFARDRRGRLLRLPDGFTFGWQLLSLAADHPLALFGEWDGEVFSPLSVFIDGWRALIAWKSLP
jgi:hypothetical protein